MTTEKPKMTAQEIADKLNALNLYKADPARRFYVTHDSFITFTADISQEKQVDDLAKDLQALGLVTVPPTRPENSVVNQISFIPGFVDVAVLNSTTQSQADILHQNRLYDNSTRTPTTPHPVVASLVAAEEAFGGKQGVALVDAISTAQQHIALDEMLKLQLERQRTIAKNARSLMKPF